MEGTFFDFLNNFQAGTFVAVISFAAIAFASLYSWYKKQLKRHDDALKEQIAKSNANDNLKESVQQIKDVVTRMNNNQSEHNKSVDDQLQSLNSRLDEVCSKSIDGDKKLAEQLESYNKQSEEMSCKLDRLGNSFDLLIRSDKEEIKASITNQYYKCIEKKYIEPYILDSMETRFATYLQENGDSFVENLMIEMRAMPKSKPPVRKKKTAKSLLSVSSTEEK